MIKLRNHRWTCDKVGNERPVYKLLDPPLGVGGISYL